MSNAFFIISVVLAAKIQTDSEIILKWTTFFRLFELHRESMLILNKLVADYKTIFGANGFGYGQSKACRIGVFAFSVECFENGFGIQSLVFSGVSNG
jgi:hypothetical protein